MVLTGPAKQIKRTLVYIVAGGFVSERSEHFSGAGRAGGNGETRQRARKGMRLVGYEPKACTPKPWTSCTPSLESSSQKQGYRHVLAKHARPGKFTFVVGLQSKKLYRWY